MEESTKNKLEKERRRNRQLAKRNQWRSQKVKVSNEHDIVSHMSNHSTQMWSVRMTIIGKVLSFDHGWPKRWVNIYHFTPSHATCITGGMLHVLWNVLYVNLLFKKFSKIIFYNFVLYVLSKKVCKIKILSFNYFHATKTLLKSYIQNVTGACENYPCEHKWHHVIFSLISLVLSVLSCFCKLQKKVH